jgi:hypothetical protein
MNQIQKYQNYRSCIFFHTDGVPRKKLTILTLTENINKNVGNFLLEIQMSLLFFEDIFKIKNYLTP